MEANYMAVSILFFVRNRTRDKLFRTFRKSFLKFSSSRKLFRQRENFANLADSAAIRLVQKSSKSEPSSPFFGRLKFRGKFVPCELLQNFLCGYKIEMAIWKNQRNNFDDDNNIVALLLS